MRDAGDALALLRGCGGHQCAGADEEHLFELPGGKLPQDDRAQHRGGAPAAGTAGVDVLRLAFVDHQAAIVVNFPDVDAVLFQNLVHQLAADRAEVAGEDQVVVRGGGAGVGQIVVQCLRGGGGHRCAHVVGVLDAKVCDAPKGYGVDFHLPAPVRPDDDRTSRGRGPLGGRGALPAVFQRETELPLRGAEMRGGHGHGPPRDPGFHKQGRQAQGLGHCGAGPILAKKGNSQAAQAEGRGNALV